MKNRIIFFLLIIVSVFDLAAQGTEDNKPLKIFFDAYGSLFRYVQTDLDYVDIVRNPELAEIYILMNSTRTGSGGEEYTLTFVGQNGFTGINDTLSHTIQQNTPNDKRNDEIVKLIKIGLVRYIAKTPNKKFLNIEFNKKFEKEIKKDNWDGWVFGVGVNGSFEAEESQKQVEWELDIDVDRVSEDSKFKIDANISNDLETYTSDDGESSISKRRRFIRSLYVLSISDHFSAGFFTGFRNNTYDNIKSSFDFAPAIEYNYFPYQESVRRNFTFLYRIGYLYQNYYNETIYFKNSENLFRHSLSIGYRINETWGDARFFLTSSSFLHDFSKNRIELWSRFSYMLSGSFSFNVQAEISYINDQLYLEQNGASLEEVLLNQKSLATQYQYQIRLGFQYTFGSIYNNVVNTRF